MNDFWARLFDSPETLGIMLPIVAVVLVAIIIVVKKVFDHRERMAMIERGIHPDCPPEDEQVKQELPAKGGVL
jgi:hypothetical protein